MRTRHVRRQVTTRALVATFLLVALQAGAWAEGRTPTQRFEAAFKQYCEQPNQSSPVCKKDGDEWVSKRSHRWLHLDLHCSPDYASQVCQDFKGVREATAPPVLAFDHKGETWRVLAGIEPLGKVPKGEDLEKDVSGNPTVYLERGAELLVVVENTNPLLFSVSKGESKEEDIASLEDLDQLAGLLGGVIQGLSRVNSLVKTAIGVDPSKQLHELLEAAKGNVTRLGLGTSQALTTIQDLELGNEVAATRCTPDAPPVSEVSGGLQALHDARQQLEKACPDILAVRQMYFEILEADVSTDSKFRVVDNKIKTLIALIDSSSCKAELQALLVTDGNNATSTVEQSARAIVDSTSHGTQRNRFLADAALQLRQRQVLASLLEQAATLLKDWSTAVQSAAQLEIFSARCKAAVIGDEVGTWIVVERDEYPIKWDKIQQHTIKLVADSPYAKQVTANHVTDLEATYKIAWRGGPLFDVGFAVIHTSLKAPTFGAVTDPNDATGEAKVIAQTDDESRAGEFALILNYKILQHLAPKTRGWALQPALDIGAGLDTDNPSFFAGVSVGIGRFLRLGVGSTWQQVKELRGQEIGESVPSADDILTRDVFERDSYVSLTFSLGSLKLFSGSEE